MEPTTTTEIPKKANPLFPFMGIGSLIYAFFYTLFLYRNSSGITYPFFVGGTCLFFFLYLKKSGVTAKKFSIYITVSLILLGISTCMTDSGTLIFLNKLGIFCLFFYLMLHNLYEDKNWDISKYINSVLNIVFSSLLHVFKPFEDLILFGKNKRLREEKSKNNGKYVLFGILIAMPLLLVILLLLGSADAVFGRLIDKFFSFRINLSYHLFGISFLFLFAFFASYSLMSRLSVHDLKEEMSDKRTAEPVIGITFTGMISVVYLIFCFIQIVYLFGGWGSLPEGYTYASYAREGFFQLVFICLLNLSLVLICMKRFRKNKLLKGILTFISLCTYIMIASSAYRMILYIQVYYLTFLRVFVLWTLSVIFLLMTGALVMIYKEDFPLVRYCLITVTSLYLVFSFAHPDYWIARYNLDHCLTAKEMQQNRDDNTYYLLDTFKDFSYLSHLSMDAAPVMFKMADELGYDSGDFSYWIDNYSAKIVNNNYSLRCFNFSRWKAYDIYGKGPDL